MRRILLPLLCGVLGGLGGGLLSKGLREEPASRGPGRAVAEAPAAGIGALEARVEALWARIEALERRPTAAASDPGAPEEAAQPGAAAAPPRDLPAAAASVSARAVLDELRGKRFGSAESARLWGWLLQNSERVGEMIALLQAEVEKDPRNAELRTALATAYVAQVLQTPDGPQRGAAWQLAQAQYDEAIRIEPEHWQARFGRAFGIGAAPAFLGLKPVAIRQFEELLQIQERRPVEPDFWQTYFQLGNLYKDAGNLEKARQVWQEGRRRFPDNPQLEDALEVSTKR
jgi:tetratricopeptide (TPR) repeat protein